MGETYQGAGVDIAAGDAAVEAIGRIVASTHDRPGVIGSIGGFGGLFAAPRDGFDDPVLCAATDGVGTKIQIARAMGVWDTIGIDLVAMCVDDLACQGAEPLFFLDYISTGAVTPDRIAEVVSGVATGCRRAGAALIGGETAEHPGVMEPDDLDLVGFAVGVVDRSRILTGDDIGPGDAVIGLASPNLRSNGFSLVRRVLLERAGRSLDDEAWPGADESLGQVLLDPSVVYSPHLAALRSAVDVKACAHITGGGIVGNLNRVLPPTCSAVVQRSSWPEPPVFDLVRRLGEVAEDEMTRVFNLGVGMTAVVGASEAGDAVAALQSSGIDAWHVGRVVEGDGTVFVES